MIKFLEIGINHNGDIDLKKVDRWIKVVMESSFKKEQLI